MKVVFTIIAALIGIPFLIGALAVIVFVVGSVLAFLYVLIEPVAHYIVT